MELNAIIDRGVNTALTRRLGLGADATVALMPELAAVLPIGSQPEMDYHLGWRKYMSSGSIAAGGAATFASVAIVLPRGSNVLCVVEWVWLGPTAAEIFVSGSINAANPLTTVVGAQVRDTLQPATKPGVAGVSTQAIASIGSGGGGLYNNTFEPEALFPLIMRPSLQAGTTLDGYLFQASVANQAFDFCVLYRERMLNEQENVL